MGKVERRREKGRGKGRLITKHAKCREFFENSSRIVKKSEKIMEI